MSDKLTDMRHIRFLLYEVFKIEELLKYPYHADHSRETFDMALDAAYQLAREVFWPTYQEFDREGVQFDGRKTTVPKAMHEIWRQYKEGGWFAPNVSYELGGQQFPLSILAVTSFLFSAGNTSASMYLSGTWGAAHLIEMFGNEDLKKRYMNKLYAGEWGGTMALTEPDVGTSLGDIRTTAVKAPNGVHFLLRGVKRFISSGDHDLTPNIIHPVLAKIEGATPGVKGLSLFIVPKYRLDADGNPAEFNDVTTAGVERKMGLKGQVTATLNFGEKGDCHAWLVGEPESGLQYMFLLMNHARIFTGIQAVSGASVAYQCALQYAQERLQGREITNRDPESPQIAIINHPDVRQMLLRQKAFIEGSLGLILYCARVADDMAQTTDEEVREQKSLLLEVLTPCCKAYVSNEAFVSITLALQCLGGAGFCEEYPIAQLLRDTKVFSIYEGANGIQALDLLGRKVPMKQGGAVRALMTEISQTLSKAGAIEPLKDIAAKVQELQNEVIGVTMHLGAIGMSGDIPLYICNATMFLEMFSELAVAWQLLNQAMVAQKAFDAGAGEEEFYRAKIATATFYINNVVPQALATAKILNSDERTALDYPVTWFR